MADFHRGGKALLLTHRQEEWPISGTPVAPREEGISITSRAKFGKELR